MWLPITTAKEGAEYELRFRDGSGVYEDVGPFMLVSGTWYRVSTWAKVKAAAVACRKFSWKTA